MADDHQLGDGPIQEEYKDAMQHLARGIDQIFNGEARGSERKIGFVLLVYGFGDNPGSRCNFISNGADREDIVTLFKEMIARFEGQPEVKGHA